MSTLLTNYKSLINEIKDPSRLLVVSKKQSVSDIKVLLGRGHRLFGENRVQEACAKWPALINEYPGIELHLIGPLQTNKVKEALALFNCIQSLDRPKLAEKIAEASNKNQTFFIQVNIGEELQKSGVKVSELESFYKFCHEDLRLSIRGLMAIPPEGKNPIPYFQKMKSLQKDLSLQELSLGMSHDWKEALEQGSTMIRVGSFLFTDK